MDAFKTHKAVIDNYRSYLSSFLSIQDERIMSKVKDAFDDDGFIPEPLIQFNPSFQKGDSVKGLIEKGIFHPKLDKVFQGYSLHKHQTEAIEIGAQDKGFIVTSGTGSGKSLTFLSTIFNDLFNRGAEKSKGVKAILVYPMNALINSQEEEIKKYADSYGSDFPITFGKYTGQENQDSRAAMKDSPPDIILTNYMMLELIMTRLPEAWLRDSLKDNLKFLVFDELHTYRGRQGSDVSLLIRRIKGLAKQNLVCIGTSATMASGGSPMDKKKAIAKVAKDIFGEPYPVESIIGESLQYCTNNITHSSAELKLAIDSTIDKTWGEDIFLDHPMANWMERTIALQVNNGLLERGAPLKIGSIAQKLQNESGQTYDQCRDSIVSTLRWTENLNEQHRKENTRKSFLPFRFHQFISQTSIVSVSLESRAKREISIKPGRYWKTSNGEKLLFPLLFSRVSGYDFICVEKDVDKRELKPRNPDEAIRTPTLTNSRGVDLNEGHFCQGYIVLDEGEEFWKDDFQSIVPDSWYNTNGQSLQTYYKWQLPQRITFDIDGNYSNDDNYALRGWYIPARMRLDPTAGIVYEDVKTGEHTKLMRIGNEGRSTATTILSYSIIESLFNQDEALADQKLLSFTDNRQDASLQAGHFNDFLSTVRLRSALFHALEKRPDGLDVHEINERIFDSLGLDEAQYAKKPSENKDFPDQNNGRALKSYLLLRLLQDLKRGWRYTLPNLEQTALLKIEYERLDKLSEYDALTKMELFSTMDKDEIYDTLGQVLNYFRTNFSLDHRFLLEQRGETENLLKDKLDPDKLWALDLSERIDAPKYMVIINPGRTQRGIYTSSIGPRSGLGKFLKRKFQDKNLGTPDRDTIVSFTEELCQLLSETGFLSRKEGIKGSRAKEDGVTGYLLRTDAIRWRIGDKVHVGSDQTRVNSYRELSPRPNEFFQKLYMKDFTKFNKEIEGREHTGQIDSQERMIREDAFRNGNISSLFCSPTMELGIDIANLNVVHMRNVPPNPANYAQRGGRAGRSGQTALVFTYCSAMSPHDQNYFNAAEKMVAGSVVPPRIDLYNEELLHSHFNAFILMKLELGALNHSVAELVDRSDVKALPLQQMIIDHIESNLKYGAQKWTDEFKETISGLHDGLANCFWYHDQWFEQTITNFLDHLDRSLDRWRSLYTSANRMIEAARVTMDDTSIKHSSDEFKDAKRQHNVGLLQKELLAPEGLGKHGSNSEFYVFRYLASEGFIPGYNFTRLPVRAFVGWKHEGKGEYISRPRFIALREFGPGNLIYHKGNKHRISRMMMTDVNALQRKIKISNETGYAFLDDDAERANNDPITNAELAGSNSEYRTKLIEIGESEATPQMRISCEEEERLSAGFEINHYFNYPSGIESTIQSTIKKGGQPLLNLIYGPATKLIALNRQWRRSPTDSFSIDQRTGRWLRQSDLENEDVEEHEQKVMIFAQDTADTLYIQPLANLELTPEQIITFSYALKRGIEIMFQVEEREIGISIIGKPDAPNVMIFESAQGSLGILSLLSSEPLKMRELFLTTYEAMHFDINTKDDSDLGKTLPKASYQDLLSYYNQRHHDKLDRHCIKETLEYLIDCDVEGEQDGNDYETQYQNLLKAYDKKSNTELKLLRHLYKHELALPDKAQVNVPDLYVSADFVYNKKNTSTLVFCDGEVHDQEHVIAADKSKREKLRSKGYDVIEWHHKEPLSELMERRKDVFRKIR